LRKFVFAAASFRSASSGMLYRAVKLVALCPEISSAHILGNSSNARVRMAVPLRAWKRSVGTLAVHRFRLAFG
jgi:hypothetical protein